MIKQLLTALFAVTLIFAFSTVTFSQEKEAVKAKSDVKMEMKKEDLKKDETMKMKDEGMSPLMSLSCDPACGFRVTSHDESELLSITKIHAKTHHQKDMTDAEVKAMIKPAGRMMDKKTDTKKPDGL